MAKNVTKITDTTVPPSPRPLPPRPAGALAATTLLPQQSVGSDSPISLDEAAHALHEIVARHSAQNTRFDFGDRRGVHYSRSAIDYAMETMRDCSEDELRQLLQPEFGGAS